MELVELFYRDGDNYKCDWKAEADKEKLEIVFEDVVKDGCLNDEGYLEGVEIEDIGLSVYDIPLIKIHGYGDMDHNYVSVKRGATNG